MGKTYLAKSFLNDPAGYLSWDSLQDRELLRKHEISNRPPILVFDEIHKYSRWRMLLKGLFDKKGPEQKIIVTGSAKLDHFRKGGDSLFGRYHYFRLHPFSLPEIDKDFHSESIDLLLRFGGFPEPFIKQRDTFSKIWRNERTARVIQQDLRDLSNLKDYSNLELLADLLPSKVGSLLSLNSIGEDLAKSPHTIGNWIEILESVYHCFTISPFGAPRVKALKKQKKLYLWDWSVLEAKGAKFENFVASHLLKFCHFQEDVEGDKMELRYLKDQFGHEIDFVVLKNRKPIFAVEVKSGESSLSKNILFFKDRTNIPEYYQVHLGRKSFGNAKEGLVLPFSEFCKLKELP